MRLLNRWMQVCYARSLSNGGFSCVGCYGAVTRSPLLCCYCFLCLRAAWRAPASQIGIAATIIIGPAIIPSLYPDLLS